MKKRLWSILLLVCMLTTMVPLVETEAQAANYNAAEVTQKLSSWKSNLNGKYWNYYSRATYENQRSYVESQLKNIAVSGALDNPNASNASLGVTASPCGGKWYDSGCISNYFGNGWQCFGFGKWLSYCLFGSYPPNETAYSYPNGYTTDDGWTWISDPNQITKLEPGDYIRADNHSAVVWYTSGDNVYVAQCWGGSLCKINWGTFWGNSNCPTLNSIKSTNFVGVWKHPGSTISTAPPAEATLSIDRQYYNVGDEVTFTFGSDIPAKLYLGIYRNGQPVENYGIYGNDGEYGTSATHTEVFTEPGSYAAFMTASTSAGWKDSDWIYWEVNEVTAELSASREMLYTGETVDLTFSGFNSGTQSDGGFRLLIRKDGVLVSGYPLSVSGTPAGTTPTEVRYSYNCSSAGSYSAYMTAFGEEDFEDSNWVYWTVEKKPSYLSNECTLYPSYLTIEVSQPGQHMYSVPTSSTGKGSKTLVENMPVGQRFTAIGLYENHAGNYWYEVEHNGSRGYIYCEDAAVVEYLTDAESFNVSAPYVLDYYKDSTSNIKNPGHYVKGEISSAYTKLKKAYGKIEDSNGKVLYPTEDTVSDGKKYVLDSSTVDDGLFFSTLSRGEYILRISVDEQNYYAVDNTLKSKTITKDVWRSRFYVEDPQASRAQWLHPVPYAQNCTSASYAKTMTTTTAARMMTQPCEHTTDSTSQLLELIPVGTKVTVTHKYTNTAGEVWYQIKYTDVEEEGAKSTEIGYISADEICAHSITSVAKKAATCTAAGNKAYYTCKNCGGVFEDQAATKPTTKAAMTIAKLGHSLTETKAKAATCTEPGNKAYYTCSGCSGVFSDAAGKNATTVAASIIPTVEHTYEQYTCIHCGNAKPIPQVTMDIVLLDLQTGHEVTLVSENGAEVQVYVEGLSKEDDCTILLAAYTKDGQMIDVQALERIDLSSRVTAFVTEIYNREGKISKLKVFAVTDLSRPVPMGEAAKFGAVEEEIREDIVIATANEPPVLDPYGHNAVASKHMNILTYDYFLRTDVETLEPIPGAITEWEIVSDREWHFTIRDDMVFHNGEEVLAEDFVASMYYAREKGVFTSSYFKFFESAEVIDDTHFKVITKEVYAKTLYDMASFCVLDKDLIEADHDFDAEPVGTGPYIFKSWDLGDSLDFTANKYYWDGAPAIRNLTWCIIPDGDSRTSALESGEVDVIIEVNNNDMARLEETEGIETINITGTSFNFMVLNNEVAPFDNADFRHFMNCAIDKDALVAVALNGYGTGNYTQTPIVFAGAATEIPDAYSKELAQAYLEASGIDPTTVSFSCICSDDVKRRCAEVIRASLAEYGITMNIESMDLATYLSAVAEGNFQATIGGYTSNLMLNFVEGKFTEKQIGSSNWSRTVDPKIDEMYYEVVGILDDAERNAKLTELANYINEVCPQVPTYSQNVTRAYNADLCGFAVNPAGYTYWHEVYWTE